MSAPRASRARWLPLAVFGVILALRQWGERHAFADGEPQSSLVDESGAVVAAPAAVGADGTPLTSRNTRVVHVGDTG